ncbi:lysophospholipid acyltransferase LPCAT4 [Tachysurus vachellii]|uniref:lysophospholipid acyltransferase LPCAT4 n=1 Tax=Tachysurus vachellii TaxID=175792 RepID=UPI00296B44C2|nr:lysophospholipid acyltransferase LPCAT4 [Tachysurus vachellii]
MAMERCEGSSLTYKHTHPFVHEVKLTTAQKIRSIILGCVLFPIRITLATLFFLLMWPVARLRLAGLSREERSKPVRGWRQWFFHPIVAFLSRSVFFSMGFFWIKVKGRQATQKEAPVLAVAPHSGFLDMLVLSIAGLPTVVSRSENSNLPVIGALLEFNQSVLVSRKDPESRKKCVTQIKERLTSNGYWPQMLMFPEGTTTNGQVLIKFKPGAFLAGVPVQPVLLHYPNKIDAVRWTWKGVSWLHCLWYTAAQFYSNVTVEFLPVYKPSQDEKENPDLFADNVQKLMAKALGVLATDYIMEGLFPVTKLGGLSLPLECPSRETLKLLKSQGFSNVQVETLINSMIDRCHTRQFTITVDQLTSLLGLADRQIAAKICSFYSKSDTLDLRQLCLSLCTAAGLRTPESLLHTAFPLYDSNGDGLLSAEDLSGLMAALVGVAQHSITEMYTELTDRGQPTEGELYDLLMTHPTYKKLFKEYFEHEELRHVADRNHNGIPNGKTSRNNNGIHNPNGLNKKSD